MRSWFKYYLNNLTDKIHFELKYEQKIVIILLFKAKREN
jgi:hypothetical protein